jgi:hypothetical protein
MSRVEDEKQVGPHDTAISKKKPFPSAFEGKLVSIIGNKLVMTNKEGRECSHTLAADVKLSFEGTVCQAEDLKAGSKIRVTTKKGARQNA